MSASESLSIVEFLNTRFDFIAANAHIVHATECRLFISGPQEYADCDCPWPAYVLADIAAKRLLLADLLAEKHSVCEDCWYTCAVASEARDGGETCRDDAGDECDCGRDARVERRARLLASPFAAHEQFDPEWSVSE